MAERRLHGLQRVLGANALFSTAYGNVGSSIYYALGLVASFALGLTPVVFLIAGAFFFLTAATYAEGTAMYPEAGGSSSFARRAFNEFWSFLAAWAQMLNYVITIAISAFFVPHYIGALFWEPLRSSPGDVIAGGLIIAVLAWINIRGIKESAALNVVLAVVDFLTQLLLVAVGIVLVLSPDILVENIDLGTAPTWSNFLLAIPIGMIAYTGIETISNMAEEARDERRTIPVAINRVRLAVFAIYFTLPAVALSALPVGPADPEGPAVRNGTVEPGEPVTLLGLEERDGGFAGDPVLGVVREFDLGPLQVPAEIYVGVLAATILLIATNAGLIGVSRLVYSMGLHRQVPDALRRLHRRHNTPWIGILVFSVAAIVTLLPGQAVFLGSLYAFGAMLSFTIAHVSIVRLRRVRPDDERPYRGPGNVRIAGTDWPLFAVFGAIATAGAFVVVTVMYREVAIAGVLWLATGIAVYTWYRKRSGFDLTSEHRAVVPQPVLETEAEYDSILVALDGSEGFDAQAVATAGTLAGQRRHGIHVLVLVTVPYSLPMDARMREAEADARSIIEQARVLGGRRVTGHVERVRPGQGGRRIVEQAEGIRAAAIVMSLPRRVAGASLFGKTLETVLAARPCRVIIESTPDAQRGAAHAHDRAEIAG